MKKLKRLEKKGVVFVFLAVILLPLLNADVKTEVNIPNASPYLLKLIPNQSWAVNENLTNAFDLDDYFIDDNGDNLSYLHSNVENITVLIDYSNRVSFYPQHNFLGTRTVTFYASDGTANASSNLVYLNVGMDTEPPQWSSPSKDKVRIYQSSYVNFTTSWTDNIGLRSYIFSINQGSGWTNYSGNFNGRQNTSLYRIQISAPAGTIVYWMFCAFDTNYNLNCTDTQSFNVSTMPVPPSAPGAAPGAGAGGGAGGAVAAGIGAQKIKNFSVGVKSFKVSLKQGSAETRILKITNIGNVNLSFNLLIEGIEEFVFLSDKSFIISPGEAKEITIDFTAKKDAIPEQYFGKIIVNSSEGGYEEIVVVIDINALELEFDVKVKILEDYKRVKPGSMVKANITVRNVKDIVATNLTFYIAIKDFYGNIYDSSEEIFLFGSPLFLERNLTIPADVREGEYIFYARASDEKTLALDSDVFEAGVRFRFAAFIKSSFIFILILFLSVFSTILILRYRKEKEKERILSLYLMLNELKNLIKEEKFDAAIMLYTRIKRAYGERVSKEVLENKEKLKEEIKNLSEKLKTEVKTVKPEAGEEAEETEKKEKKEEKEAKKEKREEVKTKEEKEVKEKSGEVREIKEEKKEQKEKEHKTEVQEEVEKEEKQKAKKEKPPKKKLKQGLKKKEKNKEVTEIKTESKSKNA